jgi:hypothetical protein
VPPVQADASLSRRGRNHARRFHIASPARPASAAPDLKSSAVERFDGLKGASVSTDHPLAKAAVLHLGERWPQTLSFDELLTAARLRLGTETSEAAALERDAQTLCNILWQLYGANLVELHLGASRFVMEAGERPVASPLARLQILRSPIVTSLRHTSVRIEDELGRRMLTLLDGTRDRAALLRDLRALMDAAVPLLEERGETAFDAPTPADMLAQQMEENLSNLACHALLMA